jgi:competence protein ComFC
LRAVTWIAEAVRAALDLVLPPHCAGCGRGIPRGFWCPACLQSLRPISPPRCEICSHPFDGLIDGPFVCPNCRGRSFHFVCAIAVMPSRGPVRDLVHRLKYHGASWAARPLAELALTGFDDPRLPGPPDALVPVPLHPLRRRERGYNQAALLARELAARTRLPVLDILRRVRPTTTQTHFNRRLRMRNLRGAFRLRRGADVRDRCLLLVDDVLTTGSTMDECARVLAKAGAGPTRALAVARG